MMMYSILADSIVSVIYVLIFNDFSQGQNSTVLSLGLIDTDLRPRGMSRDMFVWATGW